MVAKPHKFSPDSLVTTGAPVAVVDSGNGTHEPRLAVIGVLDTPDDPQSKVTVATTEPAAGSAAAADGSEERIARFVPF